MTSAPSPSQPESSNGTIGTFEAQAAALRTQLEEFVQACAAFQQDVRSSDTHPGASNSRATQELARLQESAVALLRAAFKE